MMTYGDGRGRNSIHINSSQCCCCCFAVLAVAVDAIAVSPPPLQSATAQTTATVPAVARAATAPTGCCYHGCCTALAQPHTHLQQRRRWQLLLLPPQPLQQPHGHTTKTGAATPRRRPYDEIVRRKNGVPVEVRLCRHACTGILAHACLCRRVCACAATVAATVAAPAAATVAPPTRAYDEKATSMRRNRTTKKTTSMRRN